MYLVSHAKNIGMRKNVLDISEKITVSILRIDSPNEDEKKILCENGYEQYGYYTQSIENWEKIIDVQHNVVLDMETNEDISDCAD